MPVSVVRIIITDFPILILHQHGFQVQVQVNFYIFCGLRVTCQILYLVRYPALVWYLGHLDIELNEVGREQAAIVAERLSKEPEIFAIYSSDPRRAFETAQIIAKTCGCLEVKQITELRDRHLGDIQGLVLKEAAKLKPEAYQAFVSRKRDQDIPGGGESLSQLYERCTSALQDIAEKHTGEKVVLVTHSGVIEVLHERASPKGKSPGKIENTSVNVFRLYGNGDWVLTKQGDVSHLDENMVLENGFGDVENSE